MTPIERLKYSQHTFRKKWKTQAGGGISTEVAGRPGTSNLCNRQRVFSKTEKQILDEHRGTLLHKVMCLLDALEDEGPLVVDSGNQAHEANRMKQSQYNFFSKKGAGSGLDIKRVMQLYKQALDHTSLVKFLPIS